jgi:hypothetical protein
MGYVKRNVIVNTAVKYGKRRGAKKGYHKGCFGKGVKK